MTQASRRAALVRHPATPGPAVDRVEVEVRDAPDHGLSITYRLVADRALLRVPAPKAPGPADRLWEHTCFEAFVKPGTGPGYVEFNFSPSGEWARYEFAGYRERLDTRSPVWPATQVIPGAGLLELVATVPQGALPTLDRGFCLAVATVVEAADGSLSYWALRHAPGRPDFHHADAFAWHFDAA